MLNSKSNEVSKSCSPDKVLLNGHSEMKRKSSEKRLSTTANEFDSRKNNFETKSQEDVVSRSTKASEARFASTSVHIREERKSPQREPKQETRRVSQESCEVEVRNVRKSPEKTTTPKKSPFGVVLKKTSSKSDSFSTTEKIVAVEVDEELRKIEEIFDLEVLEKMVSTEYLR